MGLVIINKKKATEVISKAKQAVTTLVTVSLILSVAAIIVAVAALVK
jgi:hypothetical protein